MMNFIPERENEAVQIQRLAAQRQIYSAAKRLQWMDFVASVLVVALLAALTALMPELRTLLVAWSSIMAVGTTFFLVPWVKASKDRAARVQELFDCEVLDIPWNGALVGRKPSPELVCEWADRYRRVHPGEGSGPLLNWYAVTVQQLEPALARIACQRWNVVWDSDLRRRYATYAAWLLAGLIILLSAAALAWNPRIQDFVLRVLVPTVPISLFLYRQYRDNLDHAGILDDLRDHAEDLWSQALDGKLEVEELAVRSRYLQDAIFERRRTGPLVPDRVYKRLKKQYESTMYRAVDVLVREAEERFRG